MPPKKDCPAGKIRNPNTGRCIDANGKVAKALAVKSPKAKAVKSPKAKTVKAKAVKSPKAKTVPVGKKTKLKKADCLPPNVWYVGNGCYAQLIVPATPKPASPKPLSPKPASPKPAISGKTPINPDAEDLGLGLDPDNLTLEEAIAVAAIAVEHGLTTFSIIDAASRGGVAVQMVKDYMNAHGMVPGDRAPYRRIRIVSRAMIELKVKLTVKKLEELPKEAMTPAVVKILNKAIADCNKLKFISAANFPKAWIKKYKLDPNHTELGLLDQLELKDPAFYKEVIDKEEEKMSMKNKIQEKAAEDIAKITGYTAYELSDVVEDIILQATAGITLNQLKDMVVQAVGSSLSSP